MLKTTSVRQILIAEDDALNREVLADILRFGGYEPLQAANGAEAISMAVANHPGLILMDVHMPVLDGLDAMRQLKALASTADIPIIALTGMGRNIDVERCLGAGASTCIRKPVEMDDLLNQVKSFVVN